VGEAEIHRDERGRVVGLTLRDTAPGTIAGAGANYLLAAASTALAEYLHAPVAADGAVAPSLVVDRSDAHLDREIDAVLETLVIGLRMVERDHPSEFAIQEATIGVEV